MDPEPEESKGISRALEILRSIGAEYLIDGSKGWWLSVKARRAEEVRALFTPERLIRPMLVDPATGYSQGLK